MIKTLELCSVYGSHHFMSLKVTAAAAPFLLILYRKLTIGQVFLFNQLFVPYLAYPDAWASVTSISAKLN